MWFFVALSLLIIASLIYMIVMFNDLVKSRNFVINSFAQVDVQLKCRQNLIRNLLELVEESVDNQPKEINIVRQAQKDVCMLQKREEHRPDVAEHIDVYAQAQYALTKSLIQCNYALDNYPILTTDKHLDELRQRLVNVEIRIGDACQNYNKAVDTFNIEMMRPVNQFLNDLLKLNYSQMNHFEMNTRGRYIIIRPSDQLQKIKHEPNRTTLKNNNSPQPSEFFEDLHVI